MKNLEQTLPEWSQIIMAFTMVLGVISLLQNSIKRIFKRVDGYGYNLVLVVGFLSMSILGFIHGIASIPEVGATFFHSAMKTEVTVVKISEDAKTGGIKLVTVRTMDGIELETPPEMLRSPAFVAIDSVWMLLFDGVLRAAHSTMYALLAFFVGSAAFRAFRVKSRDAALLMGAAFIVMIGNVPVGAIISDWFGIFGMKMSFSGMKEWLLKVPNSAAQSAILIGAGLGYLSASLKILLGIERSYLGGDNV
ncbi:MAG: hypothetical protein WA705_16595 [Candidatus Ozemobacteraceae bacterium]